MLQMFSHQRKMAKLPYFVQWKKKRKPQFRRLCVEYGMKSRDLSRCTLISRITSHLETIGTVPSTHRSANADQHQSQAPEDHRCRTGIRHCQIRMSLHRRFSMNCQMRTLRFHLLLFFLSLRGNFQSSILYSTRNVYAASAFDR